MTLPTWVHDDSPIDDPFGCGERAVTFLRQLKHPKSTARGHAFQLDRWQERIVRRIYGPRHPDGRRVVRNVIKVLPRGNRKTSLAAAVSLLHTIGPEHVPGGEALFAAADKKQAAIGFREALGIINASHPKVRRAVKVSDAVNSSKRITLLADATFLETISSDADTQHGRTPTFALVDELHAWKKRDLWDVLRTGLVKVPGSLLVVATTAGRGQENVAFEIVDYARKVARGEIDDPATLPILFEAPADCDWRDESVWHLVNPGLAHGYPDIEGMRQLAREAESRPADRAAFQQLHLNIWQAQSASPFVDMSVYDEGAAPVDLEAMRGLPCWVGVDASLTTDLTAVVAAFRDGDVYSVVPHFFVPADNLQARADRDGVPYPRWAQEGFLTATPGNVIDYRAIEQHCRDLCATYDVRELAFDPAYSRQISGPLMEDGFPVVEFRQGWRTMGPAIAELERTIIGRTFRHGGNPVLRWCFDNVAIQDDGKGNRSFHKGKSKDRIDGAVACAMAVGRAAAGEGGTIFDRADFDPSWCVVA